MMSSNKQPEVSVIIPTYNCEKYIVEAVGSVLKQTYQDFEVIVVDDGSTDNTKNVLTPYSDRITYIYQANAGPAAARNVGIINSKGKYIAFLDADDVWNEKKLQIQVDCFKKDPRIDLVCSDSERFSDGGVLSGTKLGKIRVPKELTFEKLLYQNYIQTLTVMVRRECLEKVGCFDESKDLSYVEDYDLWLRVARSYKIEYLDQPLARYRFQPQNRSSNVIKIRQAVLVMLDKMCNKWPEISKQYKNVIQRSKSNLFFEMGYDCFSRNELRDSRRYFLAALNYDKLHFVSFKYLAFTLLPINAVQFIREFTCRAKG